VAIELEKSYFFRSTLVKVYPFGWYLGFSESKSKFRSPTKGTLYINVSFHDFHHPTVPAIDTRFSPPLLSSNK
jgi:hypothetical protein